MKKQLILLRHAHTGFKHHQTVDVLEQGRDLTYSGIMEAREVAQAIKKRGVSLDLICTPVLNKDKHTAKIVNETFGTQLYFMEEDYHSSTDQFIEFVRKIDDKYTTILMVNGNPPLTHLAERLIGKIIKTVTPCSAFAIDLDVEKWKDTTEGSAKLLWEEHPDFDHY
jgi:phosphohistidine phosphatase SixA